MSDSLTSDKKKPVGILSHLIEMRDRLLRAVIVIAIAFVCLFPFAKDIYDWLAAPLADQGHAMLIIGPVAPFLIPMKLTLMVAFLIALPYLFYQLWSFVAPGLYKHEKRLIYPLIASSIFLFYLGIAFVYYLLLPMMFQIIPKLAPGSAVFSPDIAHYLDFAVMMFMAFGFGFEMPIATILLISTGITTAEELKKKRAYVIIGAFIAGMLLTPPDVISQIMLAIPMWLLFELGLIFSKLFKVRIKEASDARKEMNEKDELKSTAAAAAVSEASMLNADTLWEDEEYTYEESTSGLNEYQDADAFDMGPVSTPETKPDNESTETEEFTELTDEEMDAELDAIEAEELAEESKEKTKTASKKPATRKKISSKKAPAKKSASKTTAKKSTPKKSPTKKAATKKTTTTKATTKKTTRKPATKKTAPKPKKPPTNKKS